VVDAGGAGGVRRGKTLKLIYPLMFRGMKANKFQIKTIPPIVRPIE